MLCLFDLPTCFLQRSLWVEGCQGQFSFVQVLSAGGDAGRNQPLQAGLQVGQAVESALYERMRLDGGEGDSEISEPASQPGEVLS